MEARADIQAGISRFLTRAKASAQHARLANFTLTTDCETVVALAAALTEHGLFDAFDFPPCTDCDCELATGNEEDCLGSPPPVCGDCLWGGASAASETGAEETARKPDESAAGPVPSAATASSGRRRTRL